MSGKIQFAGIACMALSVGLGTWTLVWTEAPWAVFLLAAPGVLFGLVVLFLGKSFARIEALEAKLVKAGMDEWASEPKRNVSVAWLGVGMALAVVLMGFLFSYRGTSTMEATLAPMLEPPKEVVPPATPVLDAPGGKVVEK